MKKTLAALTICSAMAVTGAQAGSLSDPVVAPAVVMVDANASSSSTAEIYVALAGLILLAVAAQ